MELSDSGSFIRLAYMGMQALGLDADSVLERCGLNAEMILDTELRTPYAAQQCFWDAIEDVSEDPDIGLHLGEKLPPYRGHVIEYLFLSSSTFGDGLLRALNYQRLLSDALTAQFGEDEQGVYVYSEFYGAAPRHLNEAVTAAVITFFKWVTDGVFQPKLIVFNHDGVACHQEYERVFGCPVSLGQPASRIYFDPEFLSLKSNHAEPELLKLHELAANKYVERLERRDLIAQVTEVIAELLEGGDAQLDKVAATLDMKPRLLRLRLSEAQTNFNQILSDYRSKLSGQLLSQTGESIDQIVYLTGFSEPATFYRAFKRWFGVTPMQYRREHRCTKPRVNFDHKL